MRKDSYISAKSQPTQKVLRIGIIQGGKIVEERLIRSGESVTVGRSNSSTFDIRKGNIKSLDDIPVQEIVNRVLSKYSLSKRKRRAIQEHFEKNLEKLLNISAIGLQTLFDLVGSLNERVASGIWIPTGDKIENPIAFLEVKALEAQLLLARVGPEVQFAEGKHELQPRPWSRNDRREERQLQAA